jgi:hypothetical protein
VFQLIGTSPAEFAIEPINLQYGHTGSPTAVVAAGNDVYFCNKRGVHSLGIQLAQSSTGDVAYNYITGIIEPTWQELNVGNLTNVVAVHDSMHNLLIFLGNRTGTNNIEAFAADYYHLDSRGTPTWSMYSNMPFASAWEVSSLSSSPEVLFGSYDGFVYKQTSAETDDGIGIPTQLIYITDLELPAFSKLWRHMLFFGGGDETTLSGNVTYDFGTTTLSFTADLSVSGGDLLGSSWVMGSSILGSGTLKEIRIPVPAHGRFATMNFNTNSTHRVTIGGFIIYAGVRRLIHA